MKRFLLFMICAVLILSFSVQSFASEVSENIENSEPVQEENPPDIVPDVSPDDYYTDDYYLNMVLANMQGDINTLSNDLNTVNDEVTTLNEKVDTIAENVPSQSEDVSETETVPDENPELGPSQDEIIVTDVQVRSVSPVTPSDTTGLKSVLLQVLGNYDAIIVEYQYQNANNSYYSYLREVQPDYPWMASFLMLSLVVYCVFRLGGGLLGRD